MSSKLPAFQFYPADWAKDPNLRRCRKAEKGLWVDLLCLMHECDERGFLVSGGTPWTDDEIAEAVGGDKAENLQLLAGLLTKGVARRDERGAIYNARMARDEHKRMACAVAGKMGGGNPNFKLPKGGDKGDGKGSPKRPRKGSSKGEDKDASKHRPKGEDMGGSKQNANPSSSLSTSASSSEKENPSAAIASDRFVKPTLGEVGAYCRERGNAVDPAQWMAHYESNGWKVGRNPMRNWQAAVVTWENNSKGVPHASPHPRATRTEQLDADARELLRDFGVPRVEPERDAPEGGHRAAHTPHGGFVASAGAWPGAHAPAGRGRLQAVG